MLPESESWLVWGVGGDSEIPRRRNVSLTHNAGPSRPSGSLSVGQSPGSEGPGRGRPAQDSSVHAVRQARRSTGAAGPAPGRSALCFFPVPSPSLIGQWSRVRSGTRYRRP